MQVTVENFNQTLPLLIDSIQKCDFVAIDSEFTGNMETIFDKPHDFDSFDDKYRKNKRAVEKFLAFEIGLTTFLWDTDVSKYVARPFNFLVYPRSTIN